LPQKSIGLREGEKEGGVKMRLVTFQRTGNSNAFDESAPVMPLFGVGAPMRETAGGDGFFSFFGEEVGIL
jgi:hypothetical protein